MEIREKNVELFLSNFDLRLKQIAKICEVSLQTVSKRIRNYSLNLFNEIKPVSGRSKGSEVINFEFDIVK